MNGIGSGPGHCRVAADDDDGFGIDGPEVGGGPFGRMVLDDPDGRRVADRDGGSRVLLELHRARLARCGGSHQHQPSGRTVPPKVMPGASLEVRYRFQSG